MNFQLLVNRLPDRNGEIHADKVNELAKNVEEFGLNIRRNFGEEDGREIIKTIIMAFMNVL